MLGAHEFENCDNIQLLTQVVSTVDHMIYDQLKQSFPEIDIVALAAFGLQLGHGPGPALCERPIISQAESLDNAIVIKTRIVFAMETHCPASDGFSAARIEDKAMVTGIGCEVISLFPAEALPIANKN